MLCIKASAVQNVLSKCEDKVLGSTGPLPGPGRALSEALRSGSRMKLCDPHCCPDNLAIGLVGFIYGGGKGISFL